MKGIDKFALLLLLSGAAEASLAADVVSRRCTPHLLTSIENIELAASMAADSPREILVAASSLDEVSAAEMPASARQALNVETKAIRAEAERLQAMFSAIEIVIRVARENCPNGLAPASQP